MKQLLLLSFFKHQFQRLSESVPPVFEESFPLQKSRCSRKKLIQIGTFSNTAWYESALSRLPRDEFGPPTRLPIEHNTLVAQPPLHTILDGWVSEWSIWILHRYKNLLLNKNIFNAPVSNIPMTLETLEYWDWQYYWRFKIFYVYRS